MKSERQVGESGGPCAPGLGVGFQFFRKLRDEGGQVGNVGVPGGIFPQGEGVG